MALSFFPSGAWAGAYLSKTAGLVQLKASSSDRWDPVRSVPQPVTPGDAVRTGLRATATLQFDDGSHVELGPNASFTLEEASGSRSLINLSFGAIKAFVQHLASRRFQVRTPTAVCSVRGTEFRVEVLSGGRTTVDLYKGLLGVEDHRGQQVLLHPNERLSVDLRGLGIPMALPSQTSIQRNNFHQIMQREMVLDMSKEQVMAAAVNELKAADFQQGKSLTDINGRRVRVEEYIFRPSANQFKFVVLNSRKESFNYFYYLGTFNQNLPSDITVALKQLGGTVGAAPDYWLTSFQSGRSNTIDSVVELGEGGHPVDVNNTGYASDQVHTFFDAATNQFVDVTGKSVYLTYYDKDALYVNGILKTGWTGTNVTTYDSSAGQRTFVSSLSNDPITGAPLTTTPPVMTTVTAIPDDNTVHQLVYNSFSDGTYLAFDNYIVSDQGKVATAADFAGAQTGAGYIEAMMKFNYEQVTTATEFQGRTIDLVVAPKVLVQSGLVQGAF